jgi:hypothetical protein
VLLVSPGRPRAHRPHAALSSSTGRMWGRTGCTELVPGQQLIVNGFEERSRVPAKGDAISKRKEGPISKGMGVHTLELMKRDNNG